MTSFCLTMEKYVTKKVEREHAYTLYMVKKVFELLFDTFGNFLKLFHQGFAVFLALFRPRKG